MKAEIRVAWKKVFALLVVVAITAGCAGTGAGGDDDGANAGSVYEVGDTGPAGGLIFYDDEADGSDDIPGARYLEAAPASTEWALEEWGAVSTLEDINGDDATAPPELDAVGAGQANTTAIVGALGDNGGTAYAAKLADELDHAGYSDWFLPSKDELDLIYQNLHDQGLGGFDTSTYWSSSEERYRDAWRQDFGSGSSTSGEKDESQRVRAVRAFGN